MRMSMRRFTRLTNAFSKAGREPLPPLALYFVFYNFIRIHKTLRMDACNGRRRLPIGYGRWKTWLR